MARSVATYPAPDGQRYEKWWQDPVPPVSHPSLAVIPHLLPQVAETHIGGKQSCSLTSQLNALHVRGQLSRMAIGSIQQRLVEDPAFDGYWIPYGEHGLRGWKSDPHILAFVLNREYDMTIATKFIEGQGTTATEQYLRAGYVAILSGAAPNGSGHARLAFEPREHPGQMLVHETLPPAGMKTWIFPYEQLPQFQTQDRAIIY